MTIYRETLDLPYDMPVKAISKPALDYILESCGIKNTGTSESVLKLVVKFLGNEIGRLEIKIPPEPG